jgi:glucan phosphorylase
VPLNAKFELHGSELKFTPNRPARLVVTAYDRPVVGLRSPLHQHAQALGRHRAHYEHEAETREAVDLITSGRFTEGEPGLFDPIRRALLDYGDNYRHLADLTDYARAHRKLDACYTDAKAWTAKAIRNVACSGKFSSDRTIREYAEEIWNLRVAPVE